MNPKISACIISYRQEDFIEETLSGALSQKLDCDYEIVAGDDASPDETLQIISTISSTDERVTIIETTENLGMHGNWARTIEACSGKYIAICEGDDFWNDSHKLQKQIDLLEKNPDAAACFSNASVMDGEGSINEYPYVDKDYGVLKAKDFFQLNHNPIPTCTLVFRRSFFDGFPKKYFESPFADWILHTLLIQKGDYIYLPETSATYRKHSGGVWSGIQEEKQLLNKLKALHIIRSLVESQYKSDVDSAIRKQLDQLLYFYREQGEKIKYYQTWLKLKLHSS